MSRQEYFMSRQDFIKWCCARVLYVTTQSARIRRLLVTIEGFYVATKFGQAKSFMSRHNVFMSRLSIFMSRQSWPGKGEYLS